MTSRSDKIILSAFLLIACFASASCTIQKMAMDGMADALSKQGASFSSDEDPQLVGDALPFALKLMESVRENVPDHPGIHLALSSGFTQYAYGWVLLAAEKAEDENFRRSTSLRMRAHKLFLRAHGYAEVGLELAHPGFGKQYGENPDVALDLFTQEDVPQLYWFAASLAMAVSSNFENTEMLQRLLEIGVLLNRCLELDGDWEKGAVHEALVSYYAAIGESRGGGIEKARPHYERAMLLSEGKSAGLFLSWAEGFAVPEQDREKFEELCRKALEVNVDEKPEMRLVNIIAQRRAAWLLEKIDDLFL